MLPVFQTLAAAIVDTVLVTVVFIRYWRHPAAGFFTASLTAGFFLDINEYLFIPQVTTLAHLARGNGLRWLLLSLLAWAIGWFFVAIYLAHRLRLRPLLVTAVLALVLGLAMMLDVNRHVAAFVRTGQTLHQITPDVLVPHPALLSALSVAFLPLLGVLGHAFIHQPEERRSLLLVLAVMSAAVAFATIATFRTHGQLGPPASVLLDFSLSGSLAYLLFRRRVFTLKEIAIQQALSGTEEGITVITHGNRIRYSNPAMIDFFGLHSGDLIAQDAPSAPLDWRSLLGDGAVACELEHRSRRLAVNATPIYDAAGRLCGHLLLARDVTEVRQAQRELERRNRELSETLRSRDEAVTARARAEAANQAKSAFLAHMSHELRTPLNAILGFAQLLDRDSGLRPVQREHLHIIRHSGEHLLGLINDILELSKIEAGAHTLNEEDFDLHKLLHRIGELFRLRAAEKGVVLRVAHTAEVPERCHGDLSKLRQVLINLVGNAVKFTDAGNIRLIAETIAPLDSAAAPGRSAQWIQFTVEDTGRGITPDELALLFQPFAQTAAGKMRSEGTGLGLSISRAFIAMMNGSITVTSAPGTGSAFRFALPLRHAAGAAPVPPKLLVAMSLAPGQPHYRVLVADDHQPSRELLARLFGTVGLEVRAVADGAAAIAAWEHFKPHIIWMDMRMPNVDGYAATRHIKATPEGRATVVIALTASAFEHDRPHVLAAGCDDLVRKPYHESELFEKMTQHLGIRFLYAPTRATTPDTPQPSATPDALAGQLAALEPTQRATLHQAARQLNARACQTVIEPLRQRDPALAEHLGMLVSSYRFDLVLAALEHSPPATGAR